MCREGVCGGGGGVGGRSIGVLEPGLACYYCMNM